MSAGRAVAVCDCVASPRSSVVPYRQGITPTAIRSVPRRQGATGIEAFLFRRYGMPHNDLGGEAFVVTLSLGGCSRPKALGRGDTEVAPAFPTPTLPLTWLIADGIPPAEGKNECANGSLGTHRSLDMPSSSWP